jgi:hypothetical protein
MSRRSACVKGGVHPRAVSHAKICGDEVRCARGNSDEECSGMHDGAFSVGEVGGRKGGEEGGEEEKGGRLGWCASGTQKQPEASARGCRRRLWSTSWT